MLRIFGSHDDGQRGRELAQGHHRLVGGHHVRERDHARLGGAGVEAAEHLRPADVAYEHRQALGARVQRLVGPLVDRYVAHEVLVEHLAHHLAHAAVPAHEHEILRVRA